MIITDIEKLRNKCDLVSENEAQELISLLEAELQNVNKESLKGIGLAASQIGIYKKAAIIRVGNIKIDLINCSICEKFDLHKDKEGCLSIPNKTCEIERFNEITIKDNFIGSVNNFISFGMVSTCIQHELDHWEGILMIDKVIPAHLNIGDNMPCPCGSKQKFKKCCKNKDSK